MRAYQTIAGDQQDLYSQNDPCSPKGVRGSPSASSAPQDSHGTFAAGFDPFKL